MDILYYQLESGTTLRFIYVRDTDVKYPFVAVAEDMGGLTGFVAGSDAKRLKNDFNIHEICSALRKGYVPEKHMLYQ